MALEPTNKVSQANAGTWATEDWPLDQSMEQRSRVQEQSRNGNQKRHEARVRTWDGETEAKPGEVPREQLQVLYCTCCVLAHQLGRSGRLERMLSRPVGGEVSVTSRL